MSQSALLLGATGQTGRYLLKELLASPQYSRVGEFGRRVTDLSTLDEASKDKLTQKTIDFEKIEESGMKEGKWDIVFVLMGTTRKLAGSAEAFEKIDREYAINAAREARVQDHEQRLVYLSSVSANPNSSFLYPRSKGLTEEGLAALGYKDTIALRPALLTGTDRPDSRPLETMATWVTGVLKHVSDKMEMNVQTLAKVISFVGQHGSEGLPASAKAFKAGKEGEKYTVLENPGITAIAREKQV